MIELKNICYEVSGGKKIFDNFSLSIPEGKLIVITGPNGSGKSSFAKILMGLVQPNSGEIVWNGQNIISMSVTDRAKAGMAFSFQQPVKIKGITVKELLEFAGGDESYLEDVGLEATKYQDREISSDLSGGEMKRIEIASVLARKAKLTIFDEPEAGIDLWSFNDLTAMFKKMRKDNPENTLIIISHQERIMKLADKLIILEKGKVRESGTPRKLIGEIYVRM